MAVAVVGAAVAVGGALAASGAFPLPWARPAPPDTSAQAQLNAENAGKIARSAFAQSFALPVDEPPAVSYITTVRATATNFELWVQHDGFSFALCDADADRESACDEPTATVVRTEVVDGRTVRVAQIRESDGDVKSGVSATPEGRRRAMTYWQNVEIRRGTPAWLSAMTQGPVVTTNGE